MRAETFRTNHISRRHCDGIISSVIDKLKGIYQSIKSKYERLYPVGKILKIIGKALQLFGAINFSRRVPEFIRTYKELTKVKIELVNTTKEFEAQKEAARKEGFAVPSGDDIGNKVNPYAKILNENKMEGFKLDLMLHAAINATSVGIGILLDIVGGIMKKRGAIKAKDSCYPLYNKAKAMYRDGFVVAGIAAKIRKWCNDLIAHFKTLPPFRKLALLLGRLAQAVGIIFMHKGIGGIAEELKLVRTLNKEIYEEWSKANPKPEMYEGWESAGEDNSPAPKPPSYVEGKYLEHGMKALRGFIAALIGALVAELAKGERKTDSIRVHDGKLEFILQKVKSLWDMIKGKLRKFYATAVGSYISIIFQYVGMLGTALNSMDSVRQLTYVVRNLIPAFRGIGNSREIVGDSISSICRNIARLLVSILLLKVGRADSMWKDADEQKISMAVKLIQSAKKIIKTVTDKFGKFLQSNGFGHIVRHLIEILAWMSAIKSYQTLQAYSLQAMQMITHDLTYLLWRMPTPSPVRVSSIAALMKSAMKFLMSAQVLFKVINLGRDKTQASVESETVQNLAKAITPLIPKGGVYKIYRRQ